MTVRELLTAHFRGELEHRQVLVIGTPSGELRAQCAGLDVQVYQPDVAWPAPYHFDLMVSEVLPSSDWLSRCDSFVLVDEYGCPCYLKQLPIVASPPDSAMFAVLTWLWCVLAPATDIAQACPSADPQAILQHRIARCDQYVKVFLHFCRRLWNLPGREVALYDARGIEGHTVAEVYYDSSWHMYDVDGSYRQVFRDAVGGILGVRELQLDSAPVVAECPVLAGFYGRGQRFFRWAA